MHLKRLITMQLNENRNSMEQEIIRVCQNWDRAIQENNVDGMASFMSEDWVIVGTEGGITDRDTFLGWVRSGALVHTLMDFEDLIVRVYNDCAVVVSRGTSSGTWEGKPFSFYEWATSTFINNNGKWKCVLTMLTPAKRN